MQDRMLNSLFMFDVDHRILNYRGFKFIQHQDYNPVLSKTGQIVKYEPVEFDERPPYMYAFWGGGVLTENQIMDYVDLNWKSLKHVVENAYKFKPLHCKHWGLVETKKTNHVANYSTVLKLVKND